MKRISKKKLQEFIDSISVVEECKSEGLEGATYYSKVDGSYLAFVGDEENLKHLLKRGITEHVTNCIGYNPTEKKWYGWSHRAIFGFGVGSICEKGHCHYNPKNEEEFKEFCLNFWGDKDYSCGDETAVITKGLDYDDETEVEGVLVSYTYNDKVPNKKLRGTTYKNFSPMPKKWGRGEWTAKTISDAKQMAIDFANGVG